MDAPDNEEMLLVLPAPLTQKRVLIVDRHPRLGVAAGDAFGLGVAAVHGAGQQCRGDSAKSSPTVFDIVLSDFILEDAETQSSNCWKNASRPPHPAGDSLYDHHRRARGYNNVVALAELAPDDYLSSFHRRTAAAPRTLHLQENTSRRRIYEQIDGARCRRP